MDSSAEMTRYLVWGFVALVGVVLAVIDWRVIKRPVFAVLLVLGMAGGAATTMLSPFNFADGGYYMEGILLSAGSALAFAGYLVVAMALFVGRHIAKRRST